MVAEGVEPGHWVPDQTFSGYRERYFFVRE
jgi:hypothetical protein